MHHSLFDAICKELCHISCQKQLVLALVQALQYLILLYDTRLVIVGLYQVSLY